MHFHIVKLPNYESYNQKTYSNSQPPPPNICIGLDNIIPSSTARDLGIIIDDLLSLSPHVAVVCKATTFQRYGAWALIVAQQTLFSIIESCWEVSKASAFLSKAG